MALLPRLSAGRLAIGVGAERVLIASGAISEERYVIALAHHLGAAFEPLDDLARASCPLDDSGLLEAPAVGLLPIQDGNDFTVVVAPRNQAARRLCLVGRAGGLPCRVRLTTRERLQRFVDRHGADIIAHKAANELKVRHPDNSAAHRLCQLRPSLVVAAGLLTAAIAVAPAIAETAAAIFVGCVFFAWTTLRLLATAVSDDVTDTHQPVSDHDLPEYTLIVALYHEASVVRRLVAALDAIDYPREKIDIKLVVESDDIATRKAIARLDLDPAYHVIVAPAGGPRTKPKALNAALPFARGKYTAVFDAEDRPEPDQLRRAAACFRDGGARLACVQGRLTIDNTADSWLTRLFTAEYCGQFDVLLPALARWQLPLPLGGSSNHFQTAALRKASAWDPYNVTEDADLGMRLSRLGYETSVMGSTTYEEAPGRMMPWLNQRTRWFKGWVRPVKSQYFSLLLNGITHSLDRVLRSVATTSQQAKSPTSVIIPNQKL